MNIPIINYQDFKSQIKSGDILLCSGTAVFSKLIQRMTKSIWSHVAFLMRDDNLDQIAVLESVEDKGVRTVPLLHYISDYDGKGSPYSGKMMIARHDDMYNKDMRKLSNYAFNLCGRHYDNEEIIKITTRLCTNSQTSDYIHKGRAYICSEYVDECYKKIGISINHGSHDFVTPNDFFVDPKVNPLGYLQ